MPRPSNARTLRRSCSSFSPTNRQSCTNKRETLWQSERTVVALPFDGSCNRILRVLCGLREISKQLEYRSGTFLVKGSGSPKKESFEGCLSFIGRILEWDCSCLVSWSNVFQDQLSSTPACKLHVACFSFDDRASTKMPPGTTGSVGQLCMRMCVHVTKRPQNRFDHRCSEGLPIFNFVFLSGASSDEDDFWWYSSYYFKFDYVAPCAI